MIEETLRAVSVAARDDVELFGALFYSPADSCGLVGSVLQDKELVKSLHHLSGTRWLIVPVELVGERVSLGYKDYLNKRQMFNRPTRVKKVLSQRKTIYEKFEIWGIEEIPCLVVFAEFREDDRVEFFRIKISGSTKEEVFDCLKHCIGVIEYQLHHIEEQYLEDRENVFYLVKSSWEAQAGRDFAGRVLNKVVLVDLIKALAKGTSGAP